MDTDALLDLDASEAPILSHSDHVDRALATTSTGDRCRDVCRAFLDGQQTRLDDLVRRLIAKHGRHPDRWGVLVIDMGDARGASIAADVTARAKQAPAPTDKPLVCVVSLISGLCKVLEECDIDIHELMWVPDDALAIVVVHDGCMMLTHQRLPEEQG